jgi:hypothetical protein
MYDNYLVEEKAKVVIKLWSTLRFIFPDLSLWDMAKLVSEALGITLRKMKRKYWYKDGQERIGSSNGKVIYLRGMGELKYIFTYFHEIGHVLLHFRTGRLDDNIIMEKEADDFARRICQYLWPDLDREIDDLSRENPIYNLAI